MLGSVDTAQVEDDVNWMLEHSTVEQTLILAEKMAEHAIPLEGWTAAPSFEVAAVDAEHRAIQRALKAVSTAKRFAERHGLSPSSTFRKMLEWYARAAWPGGELLNERTHPQMMTRLSDQGYYLTQAPDCAPSVDFSTSDPIPLEQLSGLTGRPWRSSADSDSSSVVTGSSGAGSSVGSRSQFDDVSDCGKNGLESALDVCVVNP
jgi:hypothetical protein